MNTGAKKFFVSVFVFLLTFNNSPTYASTPKVFKLGSESFSEGNQLPSKYTCDGLSVSPPLTWSNEPKGTKYFAITMYTIPREGPAHWYFSIWNIPSKIHNLKESNLSIGKIGGNGENPNLGYAPPCSQGPGPKKYTFTIYALSKKLEIGPSSPKVTRELLISSLKPYLLASTELNVFYSRQSGGQNDTVSQ